MSFVDELSRHIRLTKRADDVWLSLAEKALTSRNLKATQPVEVEVELPGITASFFNMPRTEEFFTNSRGERIHVRTWVPAIPAETKAVLFFVHGYGGHINSPAPCAFARGLSEDGFLVVTYDASGHGFSDGERCHISSYRHWVDDCLELISLVMGSSGGGGGGGDSGGGGSSGSFGSGGGNSDANVNLTGMGANGSVIHGGFSGGGGGGGQASNHLAAPPELKALLPQLRFAIAGQSLGGGVCLLAGRALDASGDPRFMGAVLLCPAIQANTPPAALVFVLRHFVASWMPRHTIPTWLEKLQDPEAHWTRKIDALRCKLDRWGEPDGLSWGQNLRFGMGVQLLDMAAENEATLAEVRFPFVVMHDPADRIIRFSGTEKLLEQAGSVDATLVRMPGLRHDLLSNANATIRAEATQWLSERVGRDRGGSGISGSSGGSGNGGGGM